MLQCFERSDFVARSHVRWYNERKRRGGSELSTHKFDCMTQTFNARAEETMLSLFLNHVGTYSEQDVVDLKIPTVNAFNCTGIHEYGCVVDFWKGKHGPEMLRQMGLLALRHWVTFKNDTDAKGIFAFVCDQGICRSSAVVLTLLVASGRIRHSEILFAAEYLVFDKCDFNLLHCRRKVSMLSGPCILEAAALMGPINLPI
jgi:hypothetical protein